MEPGSFAALDERLRRLEREAAALRAELSAVAPAPAQPTARPAHDPADVSPVQAGPGALERFFAGRGLQLAGLFLVLLGAAFFLNLAFTRGWVGPAERILLGLLAGSALIAVGVRRPWPAQAAMAESLIALGSGILYLSLWAAVAVFPELHVPRAAAFVAMISVTSVLGALAAARHAERIALLGLAGGFITPLLLSSDTPTRVTLAVYLLVLAGTFAALAVRARFRFVEAAAFVASLLYLPVFAPAEPAWPVGSAYAVTTLVFVLFATAFSAGAVRDGEASALRLALLAVDTLGYAVMLSLVFDGRPTSLGIALLVLAGACLGAARVPAAPRALALAYGYLGLAATTLALPALIHQESLLDTLAVEGAVLVLLGARRPDRVVAAAGAVLIGIAGLWFIGDAVSSPPAKTAFSSVTVAFVVVTGALVFVRAQIGAFAFGRAAAGWDAAASVATNVVALAGITRVLLDALGGPAWDVTVPSHAQVALSVAWTAYAALLFGLGVRHASPVLQRQGLILFAFTIFKVFAIDLGNVDLTWRIASFVVLGLACLAASAWYMRATAEPARDESHA